MKKKNITKKKVGRKLLNKKRSKITKTNTKSSVQSAKETSVISNVEESQNLKNSDKKATICLMHLKQEKFQKK